MKRRGITWAALVCIVLLLVYTASPYFSFWRFTVALRSNDSAALDARVDFPAVRESLKTQLIRWFSPANSEMRIKNKRLARLSRSITPEFINALVDAYVTPDGLRALLSDPKAVREIRYPQQLHIGRPADWSKVQYAFFTSPRVFVVDLEGVSLRFGLMGLRWCLNKVDLRLEKPKS